MKRTTCRSCSSEKLEELLNFGKQPLAGFFPDNKQESLNCNKYELDLSICHECGLLQTTNIPPINEIFHKDYKYSSSSIPALDKHFMDYSYWINQRIPKKSKILEFGCNDGIFLEKLGKLGHDVYGIDASSNIVEIARNKGLNVEVGFFGEKSAEKHYKKSFFDLVTCSNVFAHTDNLKDILNAVSSLLKENGLFAIEVHNASSIFTQLHFDFIYHEHLNYYTVQSLKNLLSIHGYQIIDTEKTTMHGNGIRILAKKGNSSTCPLSINTLDFYRDKCNLINDHIKNCQDHTINLSKNGELYGYGAAGRSQIFLSLTHTAELYKCIFDDSPLRQNKYIAGSTTIIKSFEQEKGKTCVILAWNYAQDIEKKIRGDFQSIITMIPKIRTLNT